VVRPDGCRGLVRLRRVRRGRWLHRGRWRPGPGGELMSNHGTFARDVLIAPVVSEKSYALLDDNKYTFVVHPDANKTQIKIAVEEIFGVKVTGVNTINRKG